MISQVIIDVMVAFINVVTSWIPDVTQLPTILGVDTDYQLDYYFGMLYHISDSFWLVGDLLIAFVFLLVYYSTKRVIIFFLGNRAS